MRWLSNLATHLSGKVVVPSDENYRNASRIWAKSASRPQAVIRCHCAGDVQVAIRAAAEAGVTLSVKAGGHDWVGRSLCDGVVIDLAPMRDVAIASSGSRARVGGGTRAIDLAALTDELAVAPVTGSTGVVGLGGLTLGGGYGPLIGQFGLASDNLIGAEVVLADGSIVSAGEDENPELLWALRGGGGNFGVATALTLSLHAVPSVHSGVVLYPFTDAAAVIDGVESVCESAPDELTVQLGLISAPDGRPIVAVVPTWSGDPAQGEKWVAPFPRLGTLAHADLAQRSIGETLSLFDGPITETQNVFIESGWVESLSPAVRKILITQFEARPTPSCYVFSHEFRGAAVRVLPEATAFGFRAKHVLLEIVVQFDDEVGDGSAERVWALETAKLLEPLTFPGGYPNLLRRDDPRNNLGYGPNAERLVRAKRKFDPHNVFSSATALPSLPE